MPEAAVQLSARRAEAGVGEQARKLSAMELMAEYSGKLSLVAQIEGVSPQSRKAAQTYIEVCQAAVATTEQDLRPQRANVVKLNGSRPAPAPQ